MASFKDAFSYMKKNGMHKGSTFGPYGSVCALGACIEVRVGNTAILDEIAAEQFPDRVTTVASACDLRPVAQLNDHPDTTLDDLRVVFEKADLRRQEL